MVYTHEIRCVIEALADVAVDLAEVTSRRCGIGRRLGSESPATTARYTRPSKEEQAEALEKLAVRSTE